MILHLLDYKPDDLETEEGGGVEWEEIVPVLGQWPGRLYVPRDLQERELTELKLRMGGIGYGFPLVGYYNHETPERFTQYNLS